MLMKNSTRICNGFSLIEVLVALVILSIGLLGISALTLNSVKANDSSAMRSQAAILANSILDSMRANKAAAVAGNYTTGLGTYAMPSGTGTGTPCSAGCTSAVLAGLDVYNWKQSLGFVSSQMLPSGDGQIAVNTTTAGPGGDLTTVTITVQWDDSRAGNVFNACATPPCAVIATLTLVTIL